MIQIISIYKPENTDGTLKPYGVVVSSFFLKFTLLSFVIVAYFTGRIMKWHHDWDLGRKLLLPQDTLDVAQVTPAPVTHESDELSATIHNPTGQHLLIDISHVDASFLRDESQLLQGLLDVVSASNVHLLSHHCHQVSETSGVSCIGIILESHISLHTWPDFGLIVFDFFTCGSHNILQSIPIIEKTFARMDTDPSNVLSKVQPSIRWSVKSRGFRDDANDVISPEIEMDLYEPFDFMLKKEVAVLQTPYQHIDIYDILSDSAHLNASTSSNQAPNRILYLGGVSQSTRLGKEAYHEALVHPALFAHPDPKIVGILGGGEGATLREVLKHKTVKEAVMIEIDRIMVETARTYLSEWSDCSDIMGASSTCCLDHHKTSIIYEDAVAWFTNRYSQDFHETPWLDEQFRLFDVIIVDILDPQDDVPFADAVYKSKEFSHALYNAVSDDGVIVFQVGMSPRLQDPSDEYSVDKNKYMLIESLKEVGFQSFHMYEEPHCDFYAPWSFLVLFKSPKNRMLWYRNSAEFEIEIHQRIFPTVSGASPLKYFDGTTMESYQVPSKNFESVFCRRLPTPESCETFYDKTEPSSVVPSSSLEVKKSTLGAGSGRGLFTKVDIEEMSSVAAADSPVGFYFSPSTVKRLYELYDSGLKEFDDIKNVIRFMDGYGWSTLLKGGKDYWVESSILLFCNHGCNCSANLGGIYEDIQSLTLLSEVNSNFSYCESDKLLFDPCFDRRMNHFSRSFDHALRKIYAGEELLCNYMEFEDCSEVWKELGPELQAMCSGERLGEITRYENE